MKDAIDLAELVCGVKAMRNNLMQMALMLGDTASKMYNVELEECSAGKTYKNSEMEEGDLKYLKQVEKIFESVRALDPAS